MRGSGMGPKDESWGFACDAWPEVPFTVMGRWGRKHWRLGCRKALLWVPIRLPSRWVEEGRALQAWCSGDISTADIPFLVTF